MREEKKIAAAKKTKEKGRMARTAADIDKLYNRRNNYVLPLIGDLENRFL